MRPRGRLSAKQRAYKAGRMAEAMAGWRSKSHLGDAMAELEREHSEADRARAADLLIRMNRK